MLETKYTKKLYSAIRKLKLDKEELKGLLLCLYINGCSSEDCAKLFESSEEKVIQILEKENLYGYRICKKCGQLKNQIEDFRQYKWEITNCKSCEKKYTDKNKERKRKYDKEYREDNKEKRKIYKKINNEKIKEYNKEYRENNKEYYQKYNKEYHQKYYENNKEKYKTYYENNKNKIKECDKNHKNKEASSKHVQKLADVEEVSGNQIKCKYCGKWVNPTISQVYSRLQGINGNDTHYIYCSDECKQECPTYRKKKYPKGFKPASSREVNPHLRQLVLERDNYTCQKCGKDQDELTVGLHCHHIIPYVNSPIEADDPDNCITLCKDCHKLVHKLPDCGYNELKCT